ncbi:hypothetical protein H0H92_015177 [Tricholoma furcatifolium]|nr:hypothetical protein H0H92_015177 [Tricholoma furcatifolium]
MFSSYGVENEAPAWGEPPVSSDPVRDAILKDKIINFIFLTAALLARVRAVQKDVDKLTAGNETLQMYIDNLTVQMVKRR